MKTHKISLSSEMVLTIREGRTTQMLRVINPQPSISKSIHPVALYDAFWQLTRKSRYQLGDLLLVREAGSYSGNSELSRIALKVTSVWVQRIQDIFVWVIKFQKN